MLLQAAGAVGRLESRKVATLTRAASESKYQKAELDRGRHQRGETTWEAMCLVAGVDAKPPSGGGERHWRQEVRAAAAAASPARARSATCRLSPPKSRSEH